MKGMPSKKLDEVDLEKLRSDVLSNHSACVVGGSDVDLHSVAQALVKHGLDTFLKHDGFIMDVLDLVQDTTEGIYDDGMQESAFSTQSGQSSSCGQ